MITDSSIREQGYIYFLEEAPELLQIIEEDLFTLAADFSTAKVHNLMRATHTIKGGAANVGLETINKIAHSLEDVFKALYSPDIKLDAQLQTLLFQAFECLQLPVTAEISNTDIDTDEILQRAASVFAQLQEILGDAFGAETYIPTSEELGFDIVLSIFETGVSQRIDSIAEILADPPENNELVDFLHTQAEVFVGLAESLNLPGFGAIANAMVDALSCNSDRAFEVGNAVLQDLQKSREAVQAGDRSQGGEASPELLRFTQPLGGSSENLELLQTEIALQDQTPDFPMVGDNQQIDNPSIPKAVNNSLSSPPKSSLRLDIKSFYRFLIKASNHDRKPLRVGTAKFYLKAIRYILGWFNHELDIPESELGLQLLVPDPSLEDPILYIENWLSELLIFLQESSDRPVLKLHRQGVIYNILLAIAQFQNADSKVIQSLQNRIRNLVREYKTHPPLTNQEQSWLDAPKLQRLLTIKQVESPSNVSPSGEEMLEAIWGEEIPPTSGSVQTHHPEQIQELSLASIDIYPPEGATTAELTVTNNDTDNTVIDSSQTAIELTSIPNLHKEDLQTVSISHRPEKSPQNNSPRNRSFVRVDVESLHKLNYLAGELLIYQKRRSLLDEQVAEGIEKLFAQLSRHQNTLNELLDIPLQQENIPSEESKNVASVSFDALEMDEYTEYQLALHSALEENLQLQETVESLDLILRNSVQVHEKKQGLAINIIDNLVEARMSPLGNILNRFPQMIENLANVYNKKVEMKLLGTQVLVDKAIAEKLYDPLLHIVRNAFDHGLEVPEVRQEGGKPAIGTIEIRAYHQGSQTIIEVRDDGKGLNFAKIQQKGMELGLLENPQPREEELTELLFSPGFSTAGKVSEISGRGMGLDIVKTQLHALNGDISLHSRPNQGTTFILKIPFSMTTEQLMLVQAGGAIYAILLDSIEKIVLPSPEQTKELEGRKVLCWDTGAEQQMIGLRSLAELMHYNSSFISGTNLNNPTTTMDHQDIDNPILILKNGSEPVGLEVDQILGEQELVIRPLGNAIAPPKYVYGCTSLANGNLILVIDGTLVLESDQMYAVFDSNSYPVLKPAPTTNLLPSGNETTTAYLESAEPENLGVKLPSLPSIETPIDSPKWVLVVDDAISLRQTISLTLQKYGYQVLQAQNGIEALEQLQRHPEISLVVSDLEMPRMNGFELLSNIRQNPQVKAKPVVVLTSRSAEKHRKLALALGATAYLTKPYLEHEFLATINGVLTEDVGSSRQLV